MKQAILTFEKCQVVLIESERGSKDVFRMKDPPKRMKYIGKLSELTEEQFGEIVESWFRSKPHLHEVFKNYTPSEKVKCLFGRVYDSVHFPFVTARESFLSKLTAEGWYTENPAGSYEETCVSLDANCRAYEESQFSLGESVTFHPEQTYLFRVLKQ